MGWEVYPWGFYDILMWTYKHYPVAKVYVMENGVAYNDEITPEDRCHDIKRVSYLRDYI